MCVCVCVCVCVCIYMYIYRYIQDGMKAASAPVAALLQLCCSSVAAARGAERLPPVCSGGHDVC